MTPYASMHASQYIAILWQSNVYYDQLLEICMHTYIAVCIPYIHSLLTYIAYIHT